jgi:N-methylhydantoinase B/oxoprolinase/acetone carboxylase alpha subunit
MRPEPETLLSWLKPDATAEEMECVAKLALGDYEIYSAKIEQILLEGRESFVRMGISGMIRSGDLCVGLYTMRGDMAVASSGTYAHGVLSQLPIKFITKNYLNDPTVGVNEGDIFYVNDAFYGGVHNPDQMAIMPIFYDGKLIAWSAAISHQPETGGVRPGGMDVSAKSKFEEGMRLPPMKVGSHYRLHSDVMEMVNNYISRAPRMQELDMRARVTGCDRLRIRIEEFCREKGRELFLGLLRKMILISEEAVRKRIRKMRDGTYRAVAFGDGLGMKENLFRISVSVTKKDDRLILDYSGASPQSDTAYNMPFHVAATGLSSYLFNFPFWDLPISCGSMAAIEFLIPPSGTLLSPDSNAAVSCGPVMGNVQLSSVYLVFDKLLFASGYRKDIQAPTATGCGMMVGGIDQYGHRFGDILGYPLNTVGQGGRPQMDGENAYGFVYAPHAHAPNLDDIEGEKPMIHLFQKHLMDSCGHGKYRSGVGTISAFIVYGVPQINYSMTATESRIQSSAGLFGGYPATAKFGLEIRKSDVLKRMKQGDKDLPMDLREALTNRSIGGEYHIMQNVRPVHSISEGEVWFCMQTGTGGYGDVLERDPTAVVKDIENKIISPWTARNIYKVVYDEETLKVDFKETEKLRQKERKFRLKRGKPFAEFELGWSKKKPASRILEYYGKWPDGGPKSIKPSQR